MIKKVKLAPASGYSFSFTEVVEGAVLSITQIHCTNLFRQGDGGTKTISICLKLAAGMMSLLYKACISLDYSVFVRGSVFILRLLNGGSS